MFFLFLRPRTVLLRSTVWYFLMALICFSANFFVLYVYNKPWFGIQWKTSYITDGNWLDRHQWQIKWPIFHRFLELRIPELVCYLIWRDALMVICDSLDNDWRRGIYFKFGPITIEINHRWEMYSARCFLNLPQNHPDISDKTWITECCLNTRLNLLFNRVGGISVQFSLGAHLSFFQCLFLYVWYISRFLAHPEFMSSEIVCHNQRAAYFDKAS